jgi:hypothetical protein
VFFSHGDNIQKPLVTHECLANSFFYSWGDCRTPTLGSPHSCLHVYMAWLRWQVLSVCGRADVSVVHRGCKIPWCATSPSCHAMIVIMYLVLSPRRSDHTSCSGVSPTLCAYQLFHGNYQSPGPPKHRPNHHSNISKSTPASSHQCLPHEEHCEMSEPGNILIHCHRSYFRSWNSLSFITPCGTW